MLSLQSQALKSLPSDHKKWAELTNKSHAMRQALVAANQGLLGQIGMTDLEFSMGRLGPGDLKRLSEELRSLTFKAALVS